MTARWCWWPPAGAARRFCMPRGAPSGPRVVLEAVRAGRALRFAPPSLQSDPGSCRASAGWRSDQARLGRAEERPRGGGAVAQNGFAQARLGRLRVTAGGQRPAVELEGAAPGDQPPGRPWSSSPSGMRPSDRCALPHVLATAPGLRKDREVVEAAVSLDWRALKSHRRAQGRSRGGARCASPVSQLAVAAAAPFCAHPRAAQKGRGPADAAAALLGGAGRCCEVCVGGGKLVVYR